MWPEDWELGANLVVAVCQPLLMVAAAAAAAYLGAFGPETDGAAVLSIVLWVATMALWLTSIVLDAPLGLLFVTGVLSMIALGGIVTGIESAALHDRGVLTTCLVVDVRERTETTSHYVPGSVDADGTSQPGYWTTSTTTYVDHRLRCDSGPVEYLTEQGSALAEEGQSLDVVYDPTGRVGPAPASRDDDGRSAMLLAVVATGLAVVLRTGGVLWERRYGW